ncbi:MAG: hypothetical protein ACOC4A_01330, partial [Spirochaetota bacterium]
MDDVPQTASGRHIDTHVELLERIVAELGRVIRGKEPFLKQLVGSLVAGGHGGVGGEDGAGADVVYRL